MKATHDMHNHRGILAFPLLLISACALAGNTTPPPGPIAPSGPTVEQVVAQADDVLVLMMGNPTEPTTPLSMWVEGFPGSGDDDRIELATFNYILTKPLGSSATGFAVTTTIEEDASFVPIALASLTGTHIQVVQIDQCITSHAGQLLCPVTVRLEDVVFTDISTTGDTGTPAGSYSATMVAFKIEITYRTFRSNGTIQNSYTVQHVFDDN